MAYQKNARHRNYKGQMITVNIESKAIIPFNNPAILCHFDCSVCKNLKPIEPDIITQCENYKEEISLLGNRRFCYNYER